jgi:hypothetical protein
MMLHPAQELEPPEIPVRFIDGLFEALEDEQTHLEASDDIRALLGEVVVAPGSHGKVRFWLEDDFAGIFSLASGKKNRSSGG